MNKIFSFFEKLDGRPKTEDGSFSIIKACLSFLLFVNIQWKFTPSILWAFPQKE
jgi:hypothetical protein